MDLTPSSLLMVFTFSGLDLGITTPTSAFVFVMGSCARMPWRSELLILSSERKADRNLWEGAVALPDREHDSAITSNPEHRLAFPH